MQFREGTCPFDGNSFTYGVTMWDTFKVGSEEPANVTKFWAVYHAKRLGLEG